MVGWYAERSQEAKSGVVEFVAVQGCGPAFTVGHICGLEQAECRSCVLSPDGDEATAVGQEVPLSRAVAHREQGQGPAPDVGQNASLLPRLLDPGPRDLWHRDRDKYAVIRRPRWMTQGSVRGHQRRRVAQCRQTFPGRIHE